MYQRKIECETHQAERLFSMNRRRIVVALVGALWATANAAQVTPDPNAGAHRPGTDTATNGVPVVNITAPSAAGVSHNQYQQFNVDKQGLILNNSAGVSQTQLGGYIVGNPNYQAGQSAKVIVNEVTSTNPTYLRGYTEVAGNAADVIIANPNGISVNGGGFINTNRATLTTGTPTFGADGSLSGLHTTGGVISIDGDGLNASNIDRLDLISRSLTVSGSVWANNLNVVTGANQVGYSDLSTQAMAGTGNAPAASIDVAALGGMYANAVHLIATEAGVGVRNAGQLASQSGDFTIDTAGQLQLTGTTSSAGNITFNGASLSNSGTLQSGGAMNVQTTGDIINNGTVYGGGNLVLNAGGTLFNNHVIAAAGNASVHAQQLASSGTLGAGVASDGSLQGSGALSVTTDGALVANGSNLASGDITLQGSALNLSGAQTRAGGNLALTSTSGDIDHTNATLATAGTLSVRSAGTVDNTGGTMQVGQLDAQAANWRNAYGSVMQTGIGPMSVQIGGMLDNTHGTWAANARDMSIRAVTLNNTGGAIEHAGTGTLSLTAGTLTNTQGQILGNGNAALNSQTIANQNGTLSVAGDATITGTDLDNSGGTVVAQNVQTFLAGTLTNQGGTWQANGALSMAVQALNNGTGQIKALGGGLSITAAQTLNNSAGGFIGSNQAVHLSAGNLVNAGQLYAGSDFLLTTQGDANNSGALQAQGNLNANVGGALLNDGGQLEAGSGQDDAALTLNAGSISNQSGRIANTGSGATTVSAVGNLDNTGGTLGGQGDVTLSAAQLTNTNGTLVSGGNFTLQSGGLGNRGGTLYSAGNLTWNNGGATLDNSGNGSIGAGGDITFTLDTLHNDSGSIAANGNVSTQLNTFDGVGRMRAGQNLLLTVSGDYTNQAGNTLFANNDFTLNVGGAFTNASGATLQSVGALTVKAASLDNQSGADINSAATTLTTSGNQSNEGRIEGDNVSLSAADITNTGTVIGNVITVNANNLTNGADLGNTTDNTPYQTGLIAAVNHLQLYVTGNVLNRDAMLYSLGDITITADASGARNNAVTNLSGDIEAGGNLFIATNQFTNERRVLLTDTYVLTAAEQAQNTQSTNVAITGATDTDLYNYCASIYVPHQLACRNNGDINNNDPLQANGYIITTDVITAMTRLTAASAESRLLAGGDITLNGSVLNSNSTIAAGNNLTINGQDGNNGGGNVGNDTVQNIAFTPTATVQTTVQKWVSMKDKSGDFGGGWHGDPDLQFYKAVTDVTLAAGTVPFLTMDPGASLNARISAGNAVDISGQDISNTVVDADGNPVIGVGLGQNASGSPITGKPGAGAQLIGTPSDPLGPIQLPSNGLYTINPGSGSPYLIETDPRFASMSGFLGSDYLLNQLGLGGDATLKRLGDAFYETQLVMDQITSLTGKRYLDGDTDALDQYKALMDAGAQEAQQFNLAVGVALTPQQIASLTQDMVWLVNQTVDGEQVLVPVVYLSQQTANTIASGAVIQGNTVTLNASHQLTNTGIVQSTQDASLQAGNLLNAGQISAGANLSVQSAQDLLNVGTIQGGNVALVAGNNLLSSASANTVNLGNVNLNDLSLNDAQRLGVNTGGKIDASGTLVAQAGNHLDLDHATLSAGNNLGLAAGNNLTATASTLAAGNNAQLIAGNTLTLNADQHTVYQGTSEHLTVQTVHDVTTLSAAGSAVLAAGNDLTSQGATLQAGDQLVISAGHDINLTAVTDNQVTQGYSREGHTDITTLNTDQTLRGTTLSGTNGVAISAGHDLNATAGTITSDLGHVALAAGNNVNLIAGQETHTQQQDSHSKAGNLLSNSQISTHDVISDTYAIGTQISGNNVSVAAGNDLNAQAAYLNADNALTLAAGNNINLTDAQDLYTEQHDTQTSSFSFFSTSSKRFGSVDPEWRDNSSSVQINQSSSVGSVLSGDSVTIAAGNNLTATHAQIVATNDVVLAAGNNLTLNAGQNTYDESQNQNTSHTGLMNNGGLSVLIGNRSTDDSYSEHDVSYSGSTVGSLNGSVTLSAGNDIHITGSDVLSQTGTAIVGKNVTIDAAVGSSDITDTHKVSQGGINVGIGGAAAQAANAAYYSVQRGSQVQDSRLSALYALQANYQVGDALTNANGGLSQDGTDGGINLQVGIGGSSASSTTTTHDEMAYGSHINSQGNVTIAATGGDLNIIGSQISGANVALAAQNNLNILSQAEHHTLQSNNQNISAGVGLQIGTDGIGIYAQAAGGEGKAHGNGITHTDSTVNANGTLTLISGNDTTLKGAQLTGQQVVGAIGNNLLIQSEQDTDDYASQQWQASGKVVIGYSSGGSLSYNQSKTNSHYQSVTDVSGIQAGDGGFNITVGGNTHLIGGVIASSADPSKNILDTGSLTYESIHNDANYSASSLGVSASYSNGQSEFGPGGFNGAPDPGIPQKGHSSSDTNSGIAQGTIIQRDGNTDLSGLDRNPTLDNQALTPIFDAQKVQENMEMGQVAGQVGMRAAGDIAHYMANHATTPEEQAAWSDGGSNKILLHGLVGAATAALGGGDALQGALGAGASEAASKAMSDYLISQKIDPYSSEGKALMALASTAIGGAVGGGSGAATALQGELYNRQLHRDEIALAKKLADESGGLYTQDQIEDAMRLSGNQALGEVSTTGMLVNINNWSSIYDTSASWSVIPGPNGSQYLTQVVPPQVSPDLANYIIANTGGPSSSYAWANELEGLPASKEPYIPYFAVIPDYISVSGNGLGLGGTLALNTHTGQIYGAGLGSVPVAPGLSFVGGWLPTNLGESSNTSAINTASLLTGAGFDVAGCYVLCVGANHAFGGDTALEVGAGIRVPIKAPTGSTGVMMPLFSLPFTPGDQPPASQGR
jgi:filamentous hemagglutinin